MRHPMSLVLHHVYILSNSEETKDDAYAVF